MDVRGQLSNPGSVFGAAVHLLPIVLGRREQRRAPSVAPQVQRRLHDDEVTRLVDRRRNGETIDALAHTFGIHRTTVMSIVRRAQRNPGLS